MYRVDAALLLLVGDSIIFKKMAKARDINKFQALEQKLTRRGRDYINKVALHEQFMLFCEGTTLQVLVQSPSEVRHSRCQLSLIASELTFVKCTCLAVQSMNYSYNRPTRPERRSNPVAVALNGPSKWC